MVGPTEGGDVENDLGGVKGRVGGRGRGRGRGYIDAASPTHLVRV